MAQAAEPPQGERHAWADWVVVWVLGPVIVWMMDVAQGVLAGVPARGLHGTAGSAAAGLLSSAGVYALVFLAVRALIELPRYLLSLFRNTPERVPPLLVAALSLLIIAWMDL